jgi:hypothetical protein
MTSKRLFKSPQIAGLNATGLLPDCVELAFRRIVKLIALLHPFEPFVVGGGFVSVIRTMPIVQFGWALTRATLNRGRKRSVSRPWSATLILQEKGSKAYSRRLAGALGLSCRCS